MTKYMERNKILVVDDEEDLCEILQFNLESEGFAVDIANSAEEALKLLTDEHELILLDVMMVCPDSKWPKKSAKKCI